MRPVQITDKIHWVGAKDPDLRVFDIIMQAPQGTSYNAYLVVGEKTALVDVSKSGFYEQLSSRIRCLIDPARIDYIILNHTEPDHSGCLEQLLADAPNAVIYGSKAAGIFIEQIVNHKVDFKVISDGEILDLGDKRLKFICAPNLHWPDSIFTYAIEDNLLFTCDVFGCHYCGDKLFDDEVSDFAYEFKYYYQHIMRPFKKDVISAINKLKELPVNIIAPSHGPVLRTDPQHYIEQYRQWSTQLKSVPNQIIIAYVSAYGNTHKMAYAIANGIKDAGGNAELFDIVDTDIDRLRDKIESAQGLIVGSPTINGDALKPVWDLLSSLATIKLRGKRAAAFGSYAWSGEAVRMLTNRLTDLKFKVAGSGIRFKLAPTEDDLEQCRRFGEDFVDAGF